jgi:hypothetical protein
MNNGTETWHLILILSVKNTSRHGQLLFQVFVCFEPNWKQLLLPDELARKIARWQHSSYVGLVLPQMNKKYPGKMQRNSSVIIMQLTMHYLSA